MPTHRLIARRRCLRLGIAAAVGAAVARPTRADPGVSADEVLIGQTLSLDAGRNPLAADALAGAQAALADVNDHGRVHGRRLRLQTLDDQGDVDTAAAHARHLIAGGAFLLFAPFGDGPSGAALAVCNEAGVPLIAPIAGAPALRRPLQPLVFPVRADHRAQYLALLAHAQGQGRRRVALFHTADATGRAHLEALREAAAMQGLSFGGGIPYRPDISDAQLAAAVEGLDQQRVDLVLNHGEPAVYGRLLRQARGAGSRVAFWGVDEGSAALAAALGPLAHGMVFSQVMPSPWSRRTALVRDYRAALQAARPGAPGSYAGLEGYAAARALAGMLARCGPALSRDTLLRTLATYDDELGGLHLAYRPDEHTGSRFVELALVGRDGRFLQ